MKIQSHTRHRTELLLMTFCGLIAAGNSAFAQTWTQTSAPTNYWTSVASSADGTKLVAAAKNDGIWVSTNSGDTWIQTSAPNYQDGYSIASSFDGTKLVAGAHAGGIYISTNSGQTWVSNNLPNQDWYSVASSADGSKLAALIANGVVFTSTDSGNTWVSSTNMPLLRSVASSADGTKLVAAGLEIYISTNSGSSWTQTNSLSGGISVASSANGTCLVAAAGQWIFISTNSGMTWMQTSAPETNWNAVASSADGSRLVAVAGGSKNPEIPVLNGPIYTSTNSGMTWVSNSVPVQYWTSVASSADGCKLVAVNAGMWNIAGGAIWISQTTPVPAVNITTTNSNLMLSWIIPSTNFVLQQNLDLTTTNWETLTDTPALNLTNLQNEVMLSPSNSSGFYRLATP
ncbi:MAG: WD40/YVTN/BNR-like repeat-containing protein [Limisphaerales bacterium]